RVVQVRFAIDQISLLSSAYSLWSTSFELEDESSVTISLGEATGHERIELIPDSFLVFEKSDDAREHRPLATIDGAFGSTIDKFQ
ncbi:hypothetical protein, partial [Gordonia malaquae]|uniref:hypothetical protein n=1 Tax=Gordonia malaquae TaxID=410332 RepID=UPI001C3F1D15